MAETTIELAPEIPTEIKCKFDTNRSQWHATRCGKQAVEIVRQYGRLEGRCKAHAGVDRRRKYGAPEFVPATPAVVAEMVNELREAAARAKEERARENAAADKRHAEYVARRAEEAKILYSAVRKDETNWRDEPTNPKWYVHRLDQSLEMVGRSFGENSAEVLRAADLPTTIKLRASSELDIAEAEALILVLQAAVAEAKR